MAFKTGNKDRQLTVQSGVSQNWQFIRTGPGVGRARLDNARFVRNNSHKLSYQLSLRPTATSGFYALLLTLTKSRSTQSFSMPGSIAFEILCESYFLYRM